MQFNFAGEKLVTGGSDQEVHIFAVPSLELEHKIMDYLGSIVYLNISSQNYLVTIDSTGLLI